MTAEDRILEIHNLLSKVDREVGMIVERLHNVQTNQDWLEGRVNALELKVEPVTWLSKTGSVVLWACALLGGIKALATIITGNQGF